MKTFKQLFTLFAAATLFAAGCVNEDPAYGKGEGTDPAQETGYLSLGGLEMRVLRDDRTETMPDDTRPAEAKGAATRATGDEADDSFLVAIRNDRTGEAVLEKSYGELKRSLSENPLELPAGAYRMEVRSEASIPDMAWDHPTYGTDYPFTIVRKETTEIGEVVCTLTNIKVTVVISADLAGKLDPDHSSSTVSLGASEARFTLGDTRAAYFRAPETLNTLDFHLSARFLGDTNPTNLSKRIEGVKAGQWRKITLVIPHSSEGGSKLDIVVENFVQDPEIVVDGTENSWEFIYEEQPETDPSTPTFGWPGHDLAQPVELTEPMLGESFVCDLAAPNGIASLTLAIRTDNTAFDAVMKAMGVTAPTDLCTLSLGDAAYGWLHDTFGYPAGSALRGQTSAHFDLAGQMRQLYAHDGEHRFTLTVVDAKGLTATSELVVRVDKSSEAAPTIVWPDHDLEQVYTLEQDMSITVLFNAPAGIRSLLVTIDAEGLMPLLSSVPELQQQFDLCTITGDAAEFLEDTVGFPTGDEVKGRTSTQFNVSPVFCNIMRNDIEPVVPGEPNTYDFRIEMTDNNGRTVRGVLQLIQPRP